MAASPIIHVSAVDGILKKTSKPKRRRSSNSWAKIQCRLKYPPRFRLISGGSSGFLGVEVLDADDFDTLPAKIQRGDDLIIWSNTSHILDEFEKLKIGDEREFRVKFLYHANVVDPKENENIREGLSAICATVPV